MALLSCSIIGWGQFSDSLSPVTDITYFKKYHIQSLKVVYRLPGKSARILNERLYDKEGRTSYQNPYLNFTACEKKYDKESRLVLLRVFNTIDDSVLWLHTKHYKYKGKTETISKLKIDYPDGNKKITKREIKEDEKIVAEIGDSTFVYDFYEVDNAEKKLPQYKYFNLNDTTVIWEEYFYDKRGVVVGIDTRYQIVYNNGQMAESGIYKYDLDEAIELVKNDKSLYMKLYLHEKSDGEYPLPQLKKYKVPNYQYYYNQNGRLIEYKSKWDHYYYTYNANNQILTRTYRAYSNDNRKVYEYAENGLLLKTVTHKDGEITSETEYQYEFYEE